MSTIWILILFFDCALWKDEKLRYAQCNHSIILRTTWKLRALRWWKSATYTAQHCAIRTANQLWIVYCLFIYCLFICLLSIVYLPPHIQHANNTRALHSWNNCTYLALLGTGPNLKPELLLKRKYFFISKIFDYTCFEAFLCSNGWLKTRWNVRLTKNICFPTSFVR